MWRQRTILVLLTGSLTGVAIPLLVYQQVHLTPTLKDTERAVADFRPTPLTVPRKAWQPMTLTAPVSAPLPAATFTPASAPPYGSRQRACRSCDGNAAHRLFYPARRRQGIWPL